ncbi:MAG: pre-peptidase C-terminal domain-containing protein [Pseudomonadota bacterium]
MFGFNPFAVFTNHGSSSSPASSPEPFQPIFGFSFDDDDESTGIPLLDSALSVFQPGLMFVDSYLTELGNDGIPFVGDDEREGTDEDDIIIGLTGDDTINGNDGDDFIEAGPGDDVVEGGGGSNTIFGGRGDDVLRSAGTPKVIAVFNEGGTEDLDVFEVFLVAGTTVSFDIDGGSGTPGSTSVDTVLSVNGPNGEFFNNDDSPLDPGSLSGLDPFLEIVVPSTGTYTITVGEFPPPSPATNPVDPGETFTLIVSIPNDEVPVSNVDGGPGDDMLIAGEGIDIFTGGPGSDVFKLLLSNSGIANTTHITDFQPFSGAGNDADIIEISGLIPPAINPEFVTRTGPFLENGDFLASFVIQAAAFVFTEFEGSTQIIIDDRDNFVNGNEMVVVLEGTTLADLSTDGVAGIQAADIDAIFDFV